MRYFTFGLAILALAISGLALPLPASIAPALGQQIPKALRDGGPDDVLLQRKNDWTVTVAAGNKDSTLMRLADELGRAVDDGNDLRVLPVVSHGPAGALEDLLHFHDVDIAVTQSDVLEYFRNERRTPNLATGVQYIARLPAAELHVTARDGFHTLEDLRGQKVVFGPPESAATVTGPIVFRRLGIPVKAVFVDLSEGIRLVRSGEAAALVGVESKPGDFWLRIPPYAGLHLVPAPQTRALADLYVGDQFTSADYPNLVGPGEKVDTIAVPNVLAVQNLPRNDDRFRRVLRLVQYLSARWDTLNEPPFYPGWRDVSLAATVPGWTRFSPSEVFRQFILWRDQQHGH